VSCYGEGFSIFAGTATPMTVVVACWRCPYCTITFTVTLKIFAERLTTASKIRTKIRLRTKISHDLKIPDFRKLAIPSRVRYNTEWGGVGDCEQGLRKTTCRVRRRIAHKDDPQVFHYRDKHKKILKKTLQSPNSLLADWELPVPLLIV